MANAPIANPPSQPPISDPSRRPEADELTRLDPYPGTWIQGVGEYLESGQARAAAIAIGPEFGIVGPELFRDAAKEAVKFADLLVVCGSAFDPRAARLLIPPGCPNSRRG